MQVAFIFFMKGFIVKIYFFMNGLMTYFSERSRSSFLWLTMQAFPMKEAMHFILHGTKQPLGLPPAFLGNKIKNDFWVQGTFKYIHNIIFFLNPTFIYSLPPPGINKWSTRQFWFYSNLIFAPSAQFLIRIIIIPNFFRTLGATRFIHKLHALKVPWKPISNLQKIHPLPLHCPFHFISPWLDGQKHM